MDKETYLESLKDRLLTASFAEWSALLSVNGLVMAAGAVSATLKPHCPAYEVAALFAASIISAFCLLANMRFLRSTYQILHDQTQKENPDQDYRRSVLSGEFGRRRKHYLRLGHAGDLCLILGILILFHLLISS